MFILSLYTFRSVTLTSKKQRQHPSTNGKNNLEEASSLQAICWPFKEEAQTVYVKTQAVPRSKHF
jgi:hypothetical protein